MRRPQTTIASPSMLQRPLQGPPIEETRERSGRSVALIIAVLAILVMVVI
jgi:hypothetical protein